MAGAKRDAIEAVEAVPDRGADQSPPAAPRVDIDDRFAGTDVATTPRRSSAPRATPSLTEDLKRLKRSYWSRRPSRRGSRPSESRDDRREPDVDEPPAEHATSAEFTPLEALELVAEAPEEPDEADLESSDVPPFDTSPVHRRPRDELRPRARRDPASRCPPTVPRGTRSDDPNQGQRRAAPGSAWRPPRAGITLVAGLIWALRPDSNTIPPDRLEEAGAIAASGRHDDAISAYAALIAEFGEHADAYLGRGRARIASGDTAGGLSDLETANTHRSGGHEDRRRDRRRLFLSGELHPGNRLLRTRARPGWR